MGKLADDMHAQELKVVDARQHFQVAELGTSLGRPLRAVGYVIARLNDLVDSPLESGFWPWVT
jgi:hypothetical protein